MIRFRLSVSIVLLLALAACGRGDITLTAVPTSVPRPTVVAVLPTTDGTAAESTPEVTAPVVPVPTAITLGDAGRGETLFVTSYTTAQGPWACNLCHSVTEQRLVGPGLGGIQTRFATYGQAQPIQNYIHEAIFYPNDFIVPADAGGAYPPNLMPQNYIELLSEQDVADIAAYILSLSS